MARIVWLAFLVAPALAADPEVSVVAHATMDVTKLGDVPALKTARTALVTDAKRFKTHCQRTFGIAPEDLIRVSVLYFKVAAGEQELAPSGVMVYTSRTPLNVEAVAKALGTKVLKKELDLTVLEDANKTHIFVGKTTVITMPWLNEDDSKLAIETSMAVKAQARDTERGDYLSRNAFLACLSMDVREIIRGIGSDSLLGHIAPQDPIAELPPAAAPLFTARVATLSVTANGPVTVIGDITFPTPNDAAAAKPALELVLKQFQRLADDTEGVDAKTEDGRMRLALQGFAARMLGSAKVVIKDRSLSVTASHELDAAVAKAAADIVVVLERNAAKQIATQKLSTLIMAAFTDMNTTGNGVSGIVENICDEKDKPLLSWRVRLLPHIGHKELYDQFKLDEPWDSAHNKPLIEKMPKQFQIVSDVDVKPGMTFYQAFVTKKGAAARSLLQDGEAGGLGYNSVTDGTSNTIAIVEAGNAVIWTKPDDVPFDPDGKLPKLGGHFDGGFHVALCDGSVRFVKNTVDEATLKAAITANGGETLVLPLDD